MKILLMLLLAAAPAAAWDRAGEAAGLLAARAEIETVGGAPLLDLLAARNAACEPVEIGGVKFLATIVFDADWNEWFLLKPAAGLGAGVWKTSDLAGGVVYRYQGLELRLRSENGSVRVESGAGEQKELLLAALFDKLYEGSMKFTAGGLVTYAVFRNLEPMTEEEGTVSLRLGSDGLYYYSVTRDRQITAAPRWLLAVNGVLYGLRLDAGSLLFVSKKIEGLKPLLPLAFERARPR